jgi:hypothetical protein
MCGRPARIVGHTTGQVTECLVEIDGLRKRLEAAEVLCGEVLEALASINRAYANTWVPSGAFERGRAIEASRILLATDAAQVALRRREREQA